MRNNCILRILVLKGRDLSGVNRCAALGVLFCMCHLVMQPHAKVNLSEERNRFNGMCLSPEALESHSLSTPGINIPPR